MTTTLFQKFDALASEACTEYGATELSRDLSDVTRMAGRRRTVSTVGLSVAGAAAIGGLGWAANLGVSGAASPGFVPDVPGAPVYLEDILNYLDTRATDDIGARGTEPQRFLDCMLDDRYSVAMLNESLDFSYDPQGELLAAAPDSIGILSNCVHTTISPNLLLNATVTVSDSGDKDWARFSVGWSLTNVSDFPVAVDPHSLVINVERQGTDPESFVGGVLFDETQTPIAVTDLSLFSSDRLAVFTEWSREVVVLDPGASLTGEGRVSAYDFLHGFEPRNPSDAEVLAADPVVVALMTGTYHPHMVVTIQVAPEGNDGARMGLLFFDLPATGTRP